MKKSILQVLTLVLTIAFGFLFGLSKSSDGDDGISTRITRYAVNTTIETRFARTHVTVDFINEENCSTKRGFTMQLPLGARVSNLKMETTVSDGGLCSMNGAVQAEEQAMNTFSDSVKGGRPAALLQAYDSSNYGVQVSLPALGTSRLEIWYEELLRRERNQIPFQVPFSPGHPVDSLIMDVFVNDPHSGVTRLVMDELKSNNADSSSNPTAIAINFDGSSASAHFEAFDVMSSSEDGKSSSEEFPRLLRGFYDTGPLPVDGLIIPDESRKCFTHLFNPSSFLSSTAGSFSRNFVFVVDVSGSMNGQKLDDAKNAFSVIIRKLTNKDYVAVHAFSHSGTESSFGPRMANTETKELATYFVNNLKTIGGTNLNDAYVDGIKKVKQMQNEAGRTESVPIVVLLTDGQGSTSPEDMSRNIKNANEGIKSKIFALAFGAGADYNLLSGISIQNNGLVVRIYEGYDDAVTQMERFYERELGTIYMTDLNIAFRGNVEVQSQTKSTFPVFADGSEVAVRFITKTHEKSRRSLPSSINNSSLIGSFDNDMFISAVISGNTREGMKNWMSKYNMSSAVANTTTANNNSSPTTTTTTYDDCHHSFVHSKISEMLMFRDGAKSLGRELIAYAPAYISGNLDDENVSLVDYTESQALSLALEAGIVWPGLTAMVTVESISCSELFQEKDTEVCYEGDGSMSGPEYDMETNMASQSSSSAKMARMGVSGTVRSSPSSDSGTGRSSPSSGSISARVSIHFFSVVSILFVSFGLVLWT